MDGLYQDFGHRLRKARRNAGLTQQQVADRVGLSRTSITNIERGTQHIALHQLFLLASAVGVASGDLMPDQTAALEELVPPRALRVVGERDRDFVLRVLTKNVREGAASNE